MNTTMNLRAGPATLEALEQALWEQGALAITLLDAADQPLLEPAPGELPLWSEITVSALLPASFDSAVLVQDLVARGLIDSPADAQIEALPDRDWERAWLDRFKPMRFGERIWICPSNVEPDPDWPVVVRLDPGLAFGTGTHPTTAMCLEWLDGQDCTDRTVIDYGCGSGVLAVAAALKGASSVLAIDHDPQALAATAENARRNGVEQRIRAIPPAQICKHQADIVLANILAGPLIDLAEIIMAAVNLNGSLVLSGIFGSQFEQVDCAYRRRLQLVGKKERDEWIRLDYRSEPPESA